MRVFSFIFGIFLITVIVFFGYYTNQNPSFVIWFGVITALVSPLAFELILFPFKAKEKELIKELSRVPKIELLLKEAKDSEEKVKLLIRQKEELDKLIAYESKRRTLEAQKEMYLLQGREAINGINSTNNELEQLTNEKQYLPDVLIPLIGSVSEDTENTISYTINKIPYALKRSSFGVFPLYGPLLFDILKSFNQIFKKMKLDD